MILPRKKKKELQVLLVNIVFSNIMTISRAKNITQAKENIAGHVVASHLARDKSFCGIYFDGESHYYIDGTAAKFRRILCLAYDEKTKKYYQLEEDGKLKEIRVLKHGA